jgi:two-component system CheB/CheR fusion protein
MVTRRFTPIARDHGDRVRAPDPFGARFAPRTAGSSKLGGRMNINKPDEPPDDLGQKDRATFPIVGIGGSAGALDALKLFLPAVPAESQMAFVIVLHLAPDHKSLLTELLARLTRLPVRSIDDGVEVEPNTVYVIPPNATLTIAHRRLRLAQPAMRRELRTPIDAFLISLAQDQAENAGCVILSGSGSDGTLGLRAIKEHGGLTLAQSGGEYDGMLRSAMATGLVDFVLPAGEMPARLVEYFRHPIRTASSKQIDLREPTDLSEILALLRTATRHDFSGYKSNTIARRVLRRMQLLQIETMQGLIDRLRRDPRELELLFEDLLIGVTNFFRDPGIFAKLETEVVPRLFDGKGPNDTIRVWVPGCATGEEAYSIAILLRERAPPEGSPKLQIFASDISQNELEVARVGRYPVAIAQDVSAERLERFFVREDGTYRVITALREMCLFSLHNLLQDAPFSKLDLISCRNLLIYLKAELQSRVIPLFHYALLDGGYLLLGNSENVTRHTRLFATVDKASHIFRRRPQTDRRIPEFPLSASAARPQPAAQSARDARAEASIQAFAERQILDRYAPAHVVINADGEVLTASVRTAKYLELPAGPPSYSIYAMARHGLRPDLRALIHRAVASGRIVVQNNVEIGTNGGLQRVDLIVHPMQQPGIEDALYMVVFQDVGDVRPAAEPDGPALVEESQDATVRQLEGQLRDTRERLKTTTEELESSNEELKSSNEELTSMNEELQSSNEELETSREEMHSINEELQTVNTELKMRVDELARANNDMVNLLDSTQIATVFLDRELEIKSFTPAAKDLLHLIDSDTGRPITHVRPRFAPDTIREDADQVLRTLEPVERQVRGSDGGARYIMRVLPYLTVDKEVGGVVFTFTDVTRISAAEARIDELTRDLRNRVDSLETLLDVVPVGIMFLDAATRQVLVNLGTARLAGEQRDGKGLRPMDAPLRLLDRDRPLPPDEQPLQRAARTGQPVAAFQGRVILPDGGSLVVLMSATPLFDERGATRGAIAVIVDLSPKGTPNPS